jgi:hypothetical protein
MKQKRGFNYLQVFEFILEREDLGGMEKLLIAEVVALRNGGDGCYAGNEYLGKLLGVSANRVAHILGALNKGEWIRVELDAARRNRRIFAGAKYVEVKEQYEASENKELRALGMSETTSRYVENDKLGMLKATCPNIESKKKENIEDSAKANAIAGELFPDSIPEPRPRQTKAAITKAENEAKAEVILASYPARSGSNYERDKRATVRALKRMDYPGLLQAVKNYAAHVRTHGVEQKFICLACNFMDRERYVEDWTNVPTSGQSAEPSKPAAKRIPSFEERRNGGQ